jgi:DNA-binding NarL/FixJ family response regulator
MEDKVTTIIADDHRIFRKGLKSLLSEKDYIHIVAEADGGGQALEMSLNHKPRIVIMDIGMPKMDGIEATRQIRERLPKTGVQGQVGLTKYAARIGLIDLDLLD